MNQASRGRPGLGGVAENGKGSGSYSLRTLSGGWAGGRGGGQAAQGSHMYSSHSLDEASCRRRLRAGGRQAEATPQAPCLAPALPELAGWPRASRRPVMSWPHGPAALVSSSPQARRCSIGACPVDCEGPRARRREKARDGSLHRQLARRVDLPPGGGRAPHCVAGQSPRRGLAR